MFAFKAATALMAPEDYEFMKFITEHGKSYGTVAEFNFRAEIFKQKHAAIQAFNADVNNTHTLGHNFFSDMTYEELKARNGYKHREATNIKQLDETTIAASIDWRTKGAVTPVKNQGQCGSCWAFSTTGAVEAAYFLKHGNLLSFSEQQLIDCSTQNSGCGGGLMDNAFAYIEKNPLETEADYAYTARNGKCHLDPTKQVGTVAGFTDVGKSAAQLKAALNISTVSVAIEADQMAF